MEGGADGRSDQADAAGQAGRHIVDAIVAQMDDRPVVLQIALQLEVRSGSGRGVIKAPFEHRPLAAGVAQDEPLPQGGEDFDGIELSPVIVQAEEDAIGSNLVDGLDARCV